MSTLDPRDRENLTAYLDGELDADTARALEAKINLDPEARKEVEALKQAWGMLDYLPKAQPSANFTHRTLELLATDKRQAPVQTGVHMQYRFVPRLQTAGWCLAIFIAMILGVVGGNALFKKAPDTTEPDEPIVRYLRVIEKWRPYDMVGDLDFLRALDHPELFGGEKGS